MIQGLAALLLMGPFVMGNMPPPEELRYRVVTELAVGGTRTCRGFEAVWSDLVPMAGFTPLEVDAPEAWLAKKGTIVSFKAREAAFSMVQVFTGSDACAPEQRRSDYRDGPDGTRLLRDGLTAPTQSLGATDLRAFDGLRMTATGDMLEVALGTGDLATDIADLQIVVHYQGCGKKPLGFERASATFRLAEGTTHRERFPLVVPDPRGAARAESVQIRGGTPVRFLLDRFLEHEGITVRCP